MHKNMTECKHKCASEIAASSLSNTLVFPNISLVCSSKINATITVADVSEASSEFSVISQTFPLQAVEYTNGKLHQPGKSKCVSPGGSCRKTLCSLVLVAMCIVSSTVLYVTHDSNLFHKTSDISNLTLPSKNW